MYPEYLRVAAADLGTPTPVKVRILGDMASIGLDLAEMLKAEIVAANRDGRDATLIIPVGPVEQYPILARMLNEERISCRNVVFIGMDAAVTFAVAAAIWHSLAGSVLGRAGSVALALALVAFLVYRSEERRVGKECSARW